MIVVDPTQWKKRWESIIRKTIPSFARVYGPISIIIKVSYMIILFHELTKTYCYFRNPNIYPSPMPSPVLDRELKFLNTYTTCINTLFGIVLPFHAVYSYKI